MFLVRISFYNWLSILLSVIPSTLGIYCIFIFKVDLAKGHVKFYHHLLSVEEKKSVTLIAYIFLLWLMKIYKLTDSTLILRNRLLFLLLMNLCISIFRYLACNSISSFCRGRCTYHAGWNGSLLSAQFRPSWQLHCWLNWLNLLCVLHPLLCLSKR